MADPVIVTLTQDTWVAVASNVTIGTVTVTVGKHVYYTRVDTGGAAPTDLTKAIPVPDGKPRQIEIAHSSAIDVYMYCNGEEGTVIADL